MCLKLSRFSFKLSSFFWPCPSRLPDLDVSSLPEICQIFLCFYYVFDLGGFGGTIDFLLLDICWLWREEMRASRDWPLLALLELAMLLRLATKDLESEGRVRRVCDP